MKNTLSFSALIQFPKSSFFPLMTAMEGVSTINTATLSDNDTYSADMSFPADQVTEVIAGVIEHLGTITRLVPTTTSEIITTTTAPVRSYVKRRKTGHGRKPVLDAATKNKISQLQAMLAKKWMSVKQLEKATGWKSSTIHARFTGLRKQDLLQSKNGPNNRMVYRIAA